MNPFKGVCGGHSKRKAKCKKFEVKQEPGIKEEPKDSDSVTDTVRPRVDGRFGMDYDEPADIDDDFNEIKNEIKLEEEENDKQMDCIPCGSAAVNDDDNEDFVGAQQPEPIHGKIKRNGNSRKKNKRTIPRNQMAKKQPRHNCHVCNHLASNKSNLKRHLKIHTGEKPHQCDVCSKSFSQKSNLNRHKQTHGKFRCLKCNEGFEQESVKINHERSCDPRRFKCEICGYRTIQKANLKRHIRIHTGDKPFECPICFKSFTNNAYLQIHSMTHIDELPNACSKCGRRFATLKDKQTHEMRCQRSIFACNQCHYENVDKHHLKVHMQSKHGAKRSIECRICGKQFVQQIRSNQHLSTAHSDQYPFQCSKCLGGYATEDAKEAHEDICGYRRYQCHLCKEYSRDYHKLKIHMRKDHTGERIQCDMCKATFIRKSDTNRHMKAVHRLKNK